MTCPLPILMMLQVAAAVAILAEHLSAAVPRVPLTFARSGRQVQIEVPPDDRRRTAERVTLAAFGRAWTKPAAVEKGGATIDVPPVRVPVVFSIEPADAPGRELGQLVAYPPADAAWDKAVRLYAAGAPGWFEQWAAAIGLPVEQVDMSAILTGAWRPAGDRGALLILGRASGTTPARVVAIARRHRVRVLVLEADWFGEPAGRPPDASLAPPQMIGHHLAALRSQNWRTPLAFSACPAPWPGIANRETWIDSAAGTLMEAVGSPGLDVPWALLSYVPWPEQLGRREEADAALIEILRLAGTVASAPPPLAGRPRLIFPPEEEVQPEERPVLAAALDCARGPSSASTRNARQVHLLDLRGPTSPAPGLLKRLADVEGEIGEDRPLLILGDDPILRRWKWAGLDREKRRSARPGVTWLPDDELPATPADRLRLMRTLTALGVPLKTRTFEEEKTDGTPANAS
jgi:hypothetical protein